MRAAFYCRIGGQGYGFLLPEEADKLREFFAEHQDKPALEKPSSASKIFCRELDIRVAEVVESDVFQPGALQDLLMKVDHGIRVVHFASDRGGKHNRPAGTGVCSGCSGVAGRKNRQRRSFCAEEAERCLGYRIYVTGVPGIEAGCGEQLPHLQAAPCGRSKVGTGTGPGFRGSSSLPGNDPSADGILPGIGGGKHTPAAAITAGSISC